MKIESKIKRKNGHKVFLDKTEYEFSPDNGYITEVKTRTHAARFLAIEEGYVKVKETKPIGLNVVTEPKVADKAPTRRGRKAS